VDKKLSPHPTLSSQISDGYQVPVPKLSFLFFLVPACLSASASLSGSPPTFVSSPTPTSVAPPLRPRPLPVSHSRPRRPGLHLAHHHFPSLYPPLRPAATNPPNYQTLTQPLGVAGTNLPLPHPTPPHSSFTTAASSSPRFHSLIFTAWYMGRTDEKNTCFRILQERHVPGLWVPLLHVRPRPRFV
jgi:hypothetical protein